MSHNRIVKEEKVAALNEVAKSAVSLVVAEYRGLTSEDLTALRQKAREEKVFVKVIKNTLAKIAVKETEHDVISDDLTGPVILGFAVDAPNAAAKLFKDFAADKELLAIKSLTLSGKRLDASQVDVVANLPTFDEALAMLLSCLQAPSRKLATALQDTYGRLARALKARSDKLSA